MTATNTNDNYTTPWTIEQLRENSRLGRREAKDEPDGVLKCEKCHQPLILGNGESRDYIYGPAWDHCSCPGAKALFAAKSAGQQLQQEEFKASQKAEQDKYDDDRRKLEEAWAKRKYAADAPKRKAARLDIQEIDLREKELSIKQRELAWRERRADRSDERDEDDEATTTPEGSTLADFTAAWDEKLDLSPLPALLKRQDGATILYVGKLNWLFGIPGSGKSWVAIIAANEAILCGGRVLIMDYEDSKATFQRRAALIGLNPALHADNMIYAAPGLTGSPTARAEAQQWLADAMDASMSLVVIDSAESSGCPSDGDNVNPWIGKMVQPWRDVGTGVLVIDHQPKRSEDRPLGPIGSQRKLAAVDGAALECSGLPWTKAKAGKIILANHKDRGGDLDAAVRKALAVIVGTYAGEGDARAFGYTIERPEQQEDVASLSMQIMDAVIDAGDDGIGSQTKLRRSVKGNNTAIGTTIETLIKLGYLLETRHGQANIYTVSQKGAQWRAGLE